jgi:hypothetical protein
MDAGHGDEEFIVRRSAPHGLSGLALTIHGSARLPNIAKARSGNLGTIFPIAWPTTSVRDRENVNDLFAFDVDDRVRELPQRKVPGARGPHRPALRRGADPPDSDLHFMQERAGSRAAPLPIPVTCSDRLLHRVRVKGYRLRRHESAGPELAPDFVPGHELQSA